MKKFISIKDLNYKDILNNINISINKNDFITISGSNKCGKTTLIKILNKEYNDIVGTVIYNQDKLYMLNTVEEELKYIIDNANIKNKNSRYDETIKLFKLNKYKKSNINSLSNNIKTKFDIAREVIRKPKILLLDDITSHMNKKEREEIIKILKKLKETTIIMTTNNLEDTILSDYLYIMYDGRIVLEGEPLEVLEQDNTLNKLGLELPFMIDLSVKLKDYNLVNKIELNMDRMVNILWK